MSFDLTNKNISDTYQNLLQKTGSNNQLYDLLGNPVQNLTIKGTLIAESYIVSQSSIVFSSGSTAFGNSLDDTHNFTGGIVAGNITASSDISSSFTSTGSFGRVNSQTGFFEAGSKISDYVFEPEYVLRTLPQVEQHISESKHLPGIPSEAEIEQWRNLSMGERDRLLLEKIEELTLYVISLQKQINELKDKN